MGLRRLLGLVGRLFSFVAEFNLMDCVQGAEETKIDQIKNDLICLMTTKTRTIQSLSAVLYSEIKKDWRHQLMVKIGDGKIMSETIQSSKYEKAKWVAD